MSTPGSTRSGATAAWFVSLFRSGFYDNTLAGSQFCVVTGSDAGLPPEYALLGRVVKGLATAERIAALGDSQSGESGTPVRPVLLERARIDAS